MKHDEDGSKPNAEASVMSSQMEMPLMARKYTPDTIHEGLENIPSNCPFCKGATAADEAREWWWCADEQCMFHHINPNEDADPWAKKDKHPWASK